MALSETEAECDVCDTSIPLCDILPAPPEAVARMLGWETDGVGEYCICPDCCEERDRNIRAAEDRLDTLCRSEYSLGG